MSVLVRVKCTVGISCEIQFVIWVLLGIGTPRTVLKYYAEDALISLAGSSFKR